MATILSLVAIAISIAALAISVLNQMRTIRISFAQRCEDVRNTLSVARMEFIQLRQRLKESELDFSFEEDRIAAYLDRLNSLSEVVSTFPDKTALIWWLPAFTSIEIRLEKTAGDASSLKLGADEASFYFSAGNLTEFRAMFEISEESENTPNKMFESDA